MDRTFKGRAKRIEDVDLPRIGHRIGVGEDVIHAILDVESRGHGFDSQGRPIILFERHWFYRHLKSDPAKLARAKEQGLAVRDWSRATYNQDQYTLLKNACAIDQEAALKSASWGLGQVMGFNHEAAGYASVQDFVQAMMDDEDNHLEAMVQFIVTNKLDRYLRALEAAKTAEAKLDAASGFARGYNGSGYKQNRYHTRIVERFEWWRGKPDTRWSPDDAVAEDKEAGVDLPDLSTQPRTPPSPSPAPKAPPKPETPVSDAPEAKQPATGWVAVIANLLKAILGGRK